MTDYKKPYFRLFCAVCDAIDALESAAAAENCPRPAVCCSLHRQNSCGKPHRKQKNWSSAVISKNRTKPL